MITRMYASVSTQGTAMAETALCGTHEAVPEMVARVLAEAELAGDWDHKDRHDCTGNDALECYACGAS